MTEAVDASTVILAREGQPVGTPWQVYMVRRHVRSEFAADVYVFPGGKVDEVDRDPDLVRYVHQEAGVVDFPVDRRLSLALRVAAIRELFEEAGILLAEDQNGGLVRFDGGQVSAHEMRKRLREGMVTMAGLAEEYQMLFAIDRLHPISRWITPEGLPRRYDTRFYVARMPRGQSPLHDEIETTEGVWITPDEALTRYREGDFPLVFPTRKHLERLAEYSSIDAACASVSPEDLTPVMPRVEVRAGEQVFLLPGECEPS